MSVLLIAGSPSEHSRSSTLLSEVARRLHDQVDDRRLRVERLQIRDLSPQALLLADWGDPSVVRAIEQVANARALVVATPVYKAAYSGVLKVFLDLLPQTALKGKVVLPIATGGSPHHMLALDYALRPVLQSLGAKHILPGLYASDSQIPKDEAGEYAVGEEIRTRLDDAVSILLHEGLRWPVLPVFAPVPFAQVQYST
ncbi:NADPH-dependent FMN reductase [Hydrogenophaga sp.]|uniref:NADPH-dependent FMN reductase n=1 Tax=Hydrogenophaga sp. TaxID=1904254 RepID=UPI0027307B01|nr:NADPH-dependent FMN reductase [Hydrogenophaga sp.]MDP2406287.1 NADPH-dependent FMN reductase [Hydrogenophaga sp.]MDP3883876.1 NADPH-dependent FMN reductase [Hydrogenophaga sp.]MDZ4176344.1 NADPH-dependent FMN reductase [Hydrogenophaga sp.]MDZ4361005.1 NADPH-dependent FMN reductase [Variovorax sp.]